MTVTPVRSAATDALTAKLDDPQTAAALLTLLDHVDLLAILVQGLSGMIERSETIGASIGDGIVELRQTFAANPALQGRDVNPDEIVSSLIALAGALPAATPGIVAAAESGVIDRILGLGLVVLETQGLEEIHVDDRGASGDHAVDQAELQHVAVDVHAAAGAGGAGQRQPGRAALVFERHGQDVGGARGVAAGEAHLPHRVDDRPGVVLVDAHMLDGGREQLGLAVGVLNVSVHSLDPQEFERPSEKKGPSRDGATGWTINT